MVRSVVRRATRLVLPAACAGLLVTCSTDTPIGPGRPGIGSVQVLPVFPRYAATVPLVIDQVRVTVVRPPADTIARTAAAFDPASNVLSLSVPVLVQGASETLDVFLELLAGPQLLFSGGQRVLVQAGTVPAPDTIPVLYVGPGANIAAITIVPRDTVVQPGGSFALTVAAVDSFQAPVPQFYISWSQSGAPAGTTLNAAGLVTASTTTGTFLVRAVTPTGITDSTTVTVAVPVPGISWTGAVSTDWAVAGNWNPAVVPTTTDTVLIGPAANQPILTAPQTAARVVISGAGARLTINGQSLAVSGDFSVASGGLLVMNSSPDRVTIGGNATFGGGNESGQLTAGTLSIGGNFAQVSGGDPRSFAADSIHRTVLTGTAPTISFANPGPIDSHFGDLDLYATSNTLLSDVEVLGALSGMDGFYGALSGCGRVLTVRQLWSWNTTFDCATLAISDPLGLTYGLSNTTFINTPATATQLTIRHPGIVAGTYSVGATFWPLISGSTGRYIDAQDPDGAATAALVVYAYSANVTNGAQLTNTAGGASVVWPGFTATWTGAVSSDWWMGGNWDIGVAPGATETAIVPSATPFVPTLLFSVTVNNLTVLPGGRISLANGGLGVMGVLDHGGTISGAPGTVVSLLSAPSAALRGVFDTVDVMVGGPYVLNGRLTLAGGSNLAITGSLTTGGNTADIAGSLSTAGAGTLVMTNPLDSVLVGGSAVFAGGSTSGALTTGVLRVAGGFSQGAFNSVTSFAPSGTHLTVLGSAAAQTVDFGSPGSGAAGSHFQNLDITPATGGLTLTVNTIVDSAFMTKVGAAAPLLSGAGTTLTARQWQVTGLTVNDVPMILNEGGVALPQQFDNVLFQNFPTTTTSTVLMDVRAVGAAVAPRPITFNNAQVQTTLGVGGLYARLVSSNGLGVTLTVISNDPNNPRTDPPAASTVNGATVVWQ